MSSRTLVYLGATALLVGCGPETAQLPQVAADRIFLNSTVYTVNASQPWAQAVAVKDGTIIYVGDNDGASALEGPDTELVDLGGQMLLPGFHDSHVHILIGVMDEDECDLLRIPTVEEVAAKLEECTSLAGLGEDGWIVGGGWGEWLWPEANPQKGILDLLFPDRPVYLTSSFGHGAWVNSKALEIAGIGADTPDPEAGIIERDAETGEASGTLRESAMALVGQHVPNFTLPQRVNRVRAAIDYLHTFGITAVIEPGLDEDLLEPILHIADTTGLGIRAVASLSPTNFQSRAFDDSVFELVARREESRRPNLNVDSVKIYMDGVIEYGTSPLLEPYADEDYGNGENFFFYSQDDVDRYFTRLDAMGLQVHVHAIGDAAIRRALNGFEAMRETNGMSDNRHQIVHLQLIHADDRPRFAELNVGAVFQSLWAYPDPAAMELDVPMLGEERTLQMYPIASIRKVGGRIVGGSDYYVTDLDPLLAIEAAITRQDPWTNAGPVLNASERVDLATMIEAYTINGAYQMKLDGVQGSIDVGKRADFVVLDRNLFEIPASEISDAEVMMTIFDGRTVYRQPGNE